MPGVAVSLLMVVAMADAAFGFALVPPIVWVAVLTLAAMAVGAGASPRRGAAASTPAAHGSLPMMIAEAVGLLAMAALTAVMATHGDGVVQAVHGHSHGAGGLLMPFAIVAAVCATGLAATLGVRATAALPRVQFASMALSTALMTAAALS